MTDNKKILICRCEFDTETRYFSFWITQVIKKAEELGVLVIDLKNERFSRENFENEIKLHDPFFVICGGHGTSDKIKGYGNEIVVEACKNDTLLKSRIAYFIGCESAKILGQSSINKGCATFIGNITPLVIGADPRIANNNGNPLQDEYVRGFMEASNGMVIKILSGSSPEDAVKEFNTIADSWIKKYSQTEEQDPNMTEAIGYLLENKKSLVSLLN